jgi:hypothetical protein
MRFLCLEIYMKSISVCAAFLLAAIFGAFLVLEAPSAVAQASCFDRCDREASRCRSMANRSEERECRVNRRDCLRDCRPSSSSSGNSCRSGFYSCSYNRGGRVDGSNPGCCLHVPGVPHVD